jgi:hypothetical protein
MAATRDILRQLENEKEALKRVYGVKSLGVFGSWARGEATAASDLDLLVEFDALSFDRYMDLKFHIEDLLHVRVDLVLKESLKPALRDRILKEVRDVA